MEAETVNVRPPQLGFIQRMVPALLPVLLVSVGYIDPGKWVANIEGGARFGYDLVSISLLFNFAAILCQYVAARITIVTGKNLAQICNEEYDKWTCMFLGVQAEFSAILLDLTMVVGVAHALNLLFGVELSTGVFLAAIDAFLFPVFASFLENGMANTVSMCSAGLVLLLYVSGVLLSQSEIPFSMNGVFSRLSGESAFALMGLLGASIVPHNFYIHSYFVGESTSSSDVDKSSLCQDHLFAIFGVFSGLSLVNYVLMNAAANVFHSTGLVVLTFHDAMSLMEQVFMSPLIPVVFLMLLFFSSQITALAWAFGGEVVLHDFLKIEIPAWLHRATIRILAVAPALYCVWTSGAEGIYQLLIFTQVLVAMMLPCSVIPLFRIASSRKIMGVHKIPQAGEVLTVATFLGFLGLNVVFVVEMVFGSSDWAGGLRWNTVMSTSVQYTTLLVSACASLCMMLWLVATPLKSASRDALLAKVSQERELRSYARRANAAAIYIQRVWRSYIVRKKAAIEIQEEWENSLSCRSDTLTKSWVSSRVLRPFLFFIRSLSVQHQKIQARDIHCLQTCFKILLESINSNDQGYNFCSLAVGTFEESKTWAFQTRRLVSLCSFLLMECNYSRERIKDVLGVSALVLRILIVFSDPKSWKIITKENLEDAETAGKMIIQFIGSYKSGYYTAVRRYIKTLTKHTDERLLITTSAVTLALRPFYTRQPAFVDDNPPDTNLAAEEYVSLILTIPRLVSCLPSALIRALKHKSILMPSFHTILILRDKILTRISEMEHSEKQSSTMEIPSIGWAIGNIISLATVSETDFMDTQGSNPEKFYVLYVHVIVTLAENLLSQVENVGIQNINLDSEATLDETGKGENSVKISFVELLQPVCQQWHLAKLLAASGKEICVIADKDATMSSEKGSEILGLLDIARFYSCMLRIFCVLNPVVGPLPVLNMLSFCPGYIVSLWNSLENVLLPENGCNADDSSHGSVITSWNTRSPSEKKLKHLKNDGVNMWVNVLNKFSGKSPGLREQVEGTSDQPGSSQVNEPINDVWDVETLRGGPVGISKHVSCLLHLFCATYAHLLVVLDDIQFYEKQVPFMLEKQQRIASVLNTLVYNGLLRGTGPENRQLMDSAIRCLHLLYERDCRHPFCPSALWLSPGRTSRPPIAFAARSHEVLLPASDFFTSPSMGSVITITPHVFPFEERVHVFREFISMDKASRKMAGEVDALGARSIEIVVRRGHVVEDGFQQLNSIGSKLKSSIHVSFVNESGLPEAGLDYGGLSKEFLTDITKAAFATEYGLFSQTSTSDRLLVPSPSARHLENGIQMIEFLGRIVGKALYEGILLDYSFSHVFIQKLLGRYSFIDELSGLDPELYRNLMYIKHYDGDLKELCLDFTVTEEFCGKMSIIELKPGGKDISVTNENKMQYIHAMADYKLNRQIVPFSNAFYRGLTDLISPAWLKLFNAHEFNQLLSGGNHDIDVDDLRRNTKYTGGYTDSSRTIKIFWEVMKGFESSERCMLLKFVTSCSRAPLLGFKYLQPTFIIHKVSCDTSLWAAIGGQDVERLPSASTCYNTLKLPTYKRASTMREKLLYAITSNAGFELS